MATSVSDSSLSFLLVGKTGYGKSSTGNSILGEERFEVETGFTSTTKECQREVARVQGRKVVVVDSPGLANTEMKAYKDIEQFSTEVATILATQPDGFDAILIIINLGVRLTKEDVQICETLDGLFGKGFTEHYGILVVTHADLYDPVKHGGLPIEDFFRQQKGLFSTMLKKCDNRVVVFDNKTENEEIRKKHVTNLLNMVAKMKKMSSGYKSETFEKAKKSRDETFINAKKPFIQQETEDQLSLILQDYDAIQPQDKNAEKFEEIITNLQKVKNELIEQDKGTNALRYIMSQVSTWENSVQRIITAIREGRDHRKAMAVAEQQMKALKSELKKNKKIVVALLIGTLGVTALGVGLIISPSAVAVVAEPAGKAIAGYAAGKAINYFLKKDDKQK